MQDSALVVASNYLSKCRCLHAGQCSTISRTDLQQWQVSQTECNLLFYSLVQTFKTNLLHEYVQGDQSYTRNTFIPFS